MRGSRQSRTLAGIIADCYLFGLVVRYAKSRGGYVMTCKKNMSDPTNPDNCTPEQREAMARYYEREAALREVEEAESQAVLLRLQYQIKYGRIVKMSERSIDDGFGD